MSAGLPGDGVSLQTTGVPPTFVIPAPSAPSFPRKRESRCSGNGASWRTRAFHPQAKGRVLGTRASVGETPGPQRTESPPTRQSGRLAGFDPFCLAHPLRARRPRSQEEPPLMKAMSQPWPPSFLGTASARTA